MAKRVLIVDDDPDITYLLEEFCREVGLEVRAVNDSREVLPAALSWKPDLITLDLEMPHADGLSILDSLHRHEPTRSIPVIIISVVADRSGLAHGNVRGVCAKPINFPALIRQIKIQLDA